MAATKSARRHLRLTITEDMDDLWDWFQGVRPRAAARELEFLLRLGVLHAKGWTAGVGAVAASGASAAAGSGGGLAMAAPGAGPAQYPDRANQEPVLAEASGFNIGQALGM